MSNIEATFPPGWFSLGRAADPRRMTRAEYALAHPTPLRSRFGRSFGLDEANRTEPTPITARLRLEPWDGPGLYFYYPQGLDAGFLPVWIFDQPPSSPDEVCAEMRELLKATSPCRLPGVVIVPTISDEYAFLLKDPDALNRCGVIVLHRAHRHPLGAYVSSPWDRIVGRVEEQNPAYRKQRSF